MKKIIFILAASVCGTMFSQINLSLPANVSNLDRQSNVFIDASSYYDLVNIGENSTGKGLAFPQTDLTKFEFNFSGITPTVLPSYFDGMIVYNIGEGELGSKDVAYNQSTMGEKVTVEPGFYYFSNPNGRTNLSVDDGKWVKIADPKGFWSLAGNGGTDDAVNYLGTKDDQNLVMKVNVDKVSIPSGDQAGYNPTKFILGNAADAPAFTKVVIGGTPTEQAEALATKTKNVQPAGQDAAANFNFVLEVFGKARFKDGIVTQASTYPDYVFDNYFTGTSNENPNYKFKKLNEVENFIKENNHLPGVTSIKELTKSENGYNVDNTQLSIQTLEKVEELYLHVIEQQKEIQALKAEITKLKK